MRVLVVIFGGLIASYVMHRLSHGNWAEQSAHTNTWIGAFNTLVLLSSSLTAVLGHKAADAGDAHANDGLLQRQRRPLADRRLI